MSVANTNIVLYLILTTIALEQLTTEQQGY